MHIVYLFPLYSPILSLPCFIVFIKSKNREQERKRHVYIQHIFWFMDAKYSPPSFFFPQRFLNIFPIFHSIFLPPLFHHHCFRHYRFSYRYIPVIPLYLTNLSSVLYYSHIGDSLIKNRSLKHQLINFLNWEITETEFSLHYGRRWRHVRTTKIDCLINLSRLSIINLFLFWTA